MNNFKKLFVLILLVALVIIAAACNNQPAPTAPGGESSPSPEYYIGIATLNMEQSEDEYRGAEELVTKYGSVDNGGITRLGREMITTYIMGFFILGVYQFIVLFVMGKFIPITNQVILLSGGYGIRNTVKLVGIEGSFDNLFDTRLLR